MPHDNTTIVERRKAFRDLHSSGCFVIPNPWDIGSAVYLERLGFKALASTSSGFAFASGRADHAMTLDQVLQHLRVLVGATQLPVNADFENGYAADTETLGENVQRCVATGVAGLSIEDASGQARQPLYPFAEAVDRIRTARAAIDATEADVMLVGRAECFLVGTPDPLNDAIRRLTAYAEAGADCLYAPGIQTADQIQAVVNAVAPKPVNVLMGSTAPFTVSQIADLGVRRISTGGALSRVAWTAFTRAAQALKDGRFDGFADLLSHGDLSAVLDGTKPA